MTARNLPRYAIVGGVIIAAAVAGFYATCSRSDFGSSSPAAKWEQRENWRRIRPGMTQQQVRDILGEPTASASDLAFTRWTYGEGAGSGKMVFAGGMLRDWTSPK
ncbi:MAG TPA: outer membrane protein assembly factor BamE [Phycisphaerae bacterium]|nr:outer membrane protein assembly factor BamE [Phycisphaerae bacterium]HRY70215.1 outer membrane protein assembly factor BamE [Phycisphaerae bacterium]HSA27430.1 outer membrane protein assembly factor BamE [Phycisphaerae bacterium]